MISQGKESQNVWRGKRVLITGAGGFIGSHLAEALVHAGAGVTALVRYNGRGDPGMLACLPDTMQKEMTVASGDIRDPFQVRSLMEGKDAVFHLAALIAIPFSYQAPQSYLEANVQGTLNVLEAARVCHTPRVIHTSTSEVYGTAQFTPITEEHPLQGQSPYSASKIGADAMAEAYWKSFEVPVATVRPFNTYGPRQSTRAVLPTIVTQALAGGPVRLGSLDPVRDLTFVTDTVNGFLLCGSADACVGTVTNLGTGRGHSIRELVEIVGQLVGRTLDVLDDADRRRPPKSEVMLLLSDNSRASERAGWTPRVGLRDGVEALVRDVTARPELYRVKGYHV